MEAKEQSNFDLFLEKIQHNQNFTFKCKIIEEYEDKNLGFIFMSILMNEKKSSKFIRASENIQLKDKEITFNIHDIKIRLINGTFYFLIEKFNQEKDINLNSFENNIKVSEYPFDSIKIYKKIEDIEKEKNHLCSFILKTTEINDQRNRFEFRDSKGQLFQVEESIFNYKFENGKIYYFSGFLYNITTNVLELTIISDIQEYSINCEKIYDSNVIFNSKFGSLINFTGRITSFNISEQYIKVKNNDNRKFKVNVNFNLLTQISTNKECKFFNFFKITNQEFSFSKFSVIDAKEETFLEFNFIDYEQIKNKYYNNIKIDNKYYPINNNKIKIKLNNSNENNIFLQEVYYVNLDNEKIKDSFKFSVELNKGKTLHIDSLLGKDGFCYQFIIQSCDEKDLPNKIPITINDGEIIYLENPDKNNNKLKELFTIINIKEQNVEKIFGIDNNNKIDNKINNKKDNTYDWKYMININKKKQKDLKKFEKIAPLDEKKKFNIPNDVLISMENLLNIYKTNFRNDEDLLKGIDGDKVISVFDEIIQILDGFKKFEFENSERDYKIVKDIVLFIIYSYADEIDNLIYIYLKNYNNILKSLINLEYIDRIKILISFIKRFMDNIIIDKNGDKTIVYDFLNLVNLDDENTSKKYPFVKKAFEIFYNIIDNLTEESPLFQGILQFNSKIYKEVLSGEILHSGTILNLIDIKLELIKHINRFIIFSDKRPKDLEDFAIFEDKSHLVIINLYSFFGNKLEINDYKNINKATCVILFLLFHECLGHQKKNINNENEKTPRSHYDNNFKDIIDEKVDSGIALEKILFGEIVDLKFLMEIDDNYIKLLLEPNLYIGKDFSNLRNIFLIINKNIENEKKEENDNNKKPEDSKIMKSSPKKKGIIDINKEKKNKPNLLLHDLFRIYSKIKDDEKELLKNDEDYKRFLMLYEKKKNPSSYAPPRFKQKFHN